MRRKHVLIPGTFGLVASLILIAPAHAGGHSGLYADFSSSGPAAAMGSSVFARLTLAPTDQAPATTPGQPAQRVIPYEYSDAYRTRAKIHRIASFATLPLFAVEGFLGQSLYDNPTSAKRGAHSAVAAAIGVLFGVNTVTGVWNLIEARHDPNGRGRRWVHGLLMLAADAGFVATAATAPDDHEGSGSSSKSTHRAIAFTSIGLATTGYLIMLFGGR
jgi:hypothetical protein